MQQTITPNFVIEAVKGRCVITLKRLNYFLISLLVIVSIANCIITENYLTYANLVIAFILSTMFCKKKKATIANNVFLDVCYRMVLSRWIGFSNFDS